ncbi:MAG: 6-phosphogluconolactonase [Pseudomonadota bacterium]
MQFTSFDTRDALYLALADAVSASIEAAVSAGRRASLVVPGGSSPAPVYRALAVRSLPWSDVDVTLTDERWVAPDDAASNQRMISETLLTEQAAAARFVPLMGEEASPEAGLMQAANRLSGLARPFDVVLLGMGLDGHTASLFPDMPTIDDGLADGAPVCLAARPESQPVARISLSAEVLGDARAVWLLVTGEDKLAVLEAGARADLPPPVVSVLSRHPEPVVWWAP